MKESVAPQPPPTSEPRKVAFLDANVLFPALLRDTLLRAAQAGLYLPKWTVAILDEMSRNLVATGRVTPEGVEWLLGEMTRAFPDAIVTDNEHLIEEMRNDVKDRHVLAAAIIGESNVLVTNNVRDFPVALVQHVYGIAVDRADGFLLDLLATDPRQLIDVIRLQASRYNRPPLTFEELLDRLEGQVPGFVLAVRQRLDEENKSGSSP